MSGDIDQGLRGEIRSILKTAGRMLTTAELYERSKLAESPTQLSAACSQMYVRHQLVRTTNEAGRFAYCLSDDEAAIAALEPSAPPPIVPTPPVVPPVSQPIKPEDQLPKSRQVGVLKTALLRVLERGPANASELKADPDVTRCLAGKDRNAIHAAINVLLTKKVIVRTRDAGRYVLAKNAGDQAAEQPLRDLARKVKDSGLSEVAHTDARYTPPAPAPIPDKVTIANAVTVRPARFKTDLMGHLQAFTEDHAELMADAIASRAPYPALDALQQARNALDAAQRCLMSQGSEA